MPQSEQCASSFNKCFNICVLLLHCYTFHQPSAGLRQIFFFFFFTLKLLSISKVLKKISFISEM